jgi:hypothetical protein
MISDDNKLLRTKNVGYKRIVPKEQKNKTDEKKYYSDWRNQDNWLFPKGPKKKRKSKKKKKK